MKPTLLLTTALLVTVLSFGQLPTAWVRYYDTTTALSGYKNLNGKIEIPAKFGGPTMADTFHNIIAVMEMKDNSLPQYYLLKDGRKVGKDSVFMFDFMYDCESEGKIMFEDRKKDRVGFLDKNGIAIIPAVYNYVSPFRNGIAVAHQNAKRECWDEKGDTTNCEHLGWEGGETVLINDKNELLADSFTMDWSSINWYSKIMNDPAIDTSIYVSLKGKKGETYSFVHYDKEFKKWFYGTFLPSLNGKDNLQNLLFDEVTYWSQNDGWTSVNKSAFIDTFPFALTKNQFEENQLKTISISQTLFNELIFEKSIYKKYLNTCGEHNRNRFPLYNVMLTYYKKRQKPVPDMGSQFLKEYDTDYQEHFEFLRTEKGYQLLSVSLKR